MARDWPLAGRAEELRLVAAALRRTRGASDPRPSGVVLAGPAGVGKTRLAREALARAARTAQVRWAYGAESARTIPLGAFAGLLGDLGDDPARLLTRAGTALTAADTRVVIGVDDAHLLDEVSATLVHQLVVRRAATVLLTVRTGEQAPGAVTALWKDEHLERMELRPLSEPETATLLEAVLGGPVDRGSAARLWRLTSGNALFLRHMVDGEVDAGRLADPGGVWRWSQRPQIPPRLGEIIGAQMGRMPEALRDVTDLLALGEPLGTSLLADLTDGAAVESAEARGLVRVDVDGRRLDARLAHPLYGELRRGEMGVLRARRLRGTVASAIAATGARRSGDTLRRAVLALDSDREPDVPLFLTAARTAIGLLDLSLAERLARAAVGAGGGLPAQLTLVYALSWGSHCAEAESVLAELEPTLQSDHERGPVAVSRAGNLFWPLGRTAQAETVLDRALATVQDVGACAVLVALQAAFDMSLGRLEQGRARGVELLARTDLSDQATVLATLAAVGSAASRGRVDEIRHFAELGFRAAQRSFDAGVIRFGLSDLTIIGARLTGHVDEAQQVARERRTETQDTPGPPQLMALVLSGQAALAAGRLRTALRWLREARAGLMALEAHEFRSRCSVHLTQALGMAGDAAEARRMLIEVEASWNPAFTVMEPDRLLAAAWVHAAEGATTPAIAAAREAAALARDRGQPAYEAFALHTAVCFGDHGGAARLAELASIVDGPRAPLAATHAAAHAAGDGDGLLSVSARWEQLPDLVAATDAAAQAAIAYTRAGQRGSAAAAAARAHRLAEAAEGARTPASTAAARPLPLTDREREIATLAARGLSNREIADQLVLSVRTVEGHLYRIGNKFGVNDRRQLGPVLGIEGVE